MLDYRTAKNRRLEEVLVMPMPGPMELILLLALVLIVFGPGKLPEIGKAVGKGMKEFRRASNDLEETLKGEVSSAASESASAGKPPAK